MRTHRPRMLTTYHHYRPQIEAQETIIQDCKPGSRPLFSHPQTYNLNLNRSPLSAWISLHMGSKPNKRRKRSTTQKRKHTFLKCFSNEWISTWKSSQEKKPLKICYIWTWKKQCKKSPFEDFFWQLKYFNLKKHKRKTHFIKCFFKNWNMSTWRGIEKLILRNNFSPTQIFQPEKESYKKPIRKKRFFSNWNILI